MIVSDWILVWEDATPPASKEFAVEAYPKWYARKKVGREMAPRSCCGFLYVS